MHYLCLVYCQDDNVREWNTSAESCAVAEALAEGGYDIAAYPLAAASEATSLRRTGDGLVLADGPITSGSARLQSVYVLGARDLNDAVRLAARLPEASTAEIEIRPITPQSRGTAAPSRADAAAEGPQIQDERPVSVKG